MRRERHGYAMNELGDSSSQESPSLPMVLMEVTEVMAEIAPKIGAERRTENSDWLWRLLADVRSDVATQPTPAAVRRMRARLEAGMKGPVRIAA